MMNLRRKLAGSSYSEPSTEAGSVVTHSGKSFPQSAPSPLGSVDLAASLADGNPAAEAAAYAEQAGGDEERKP